MRFSSALCILCLILVSTTHAYPMGNFAANAWSKYLGNNLWNNGFNPNGGTNQLQALGSRLSQLESKMDRMAAQECQTGKEEIILCDPAAGLDNLPCILTPLAFGQSLVGVQNVTFASPFENTPKVTAGVMGMAMFIGKNCSMEVVNVQPDSFGLQITVDQLTPISVTVSWMACPPAIDTPALNTPGSRFFFRRF